MSTGDADDRAAKTPDYRIAVLQHALDVLEVLGDAREPLGTTELARRLGSTKSSIYRILVNLDERGYVVKDATTTRYAIGPRLLDFGLRAGSRARLVQAAHSQLEWLNRELGETVNLGVMDEDGVLYVDIIESPHDLRMAARVGARDDAHSTALGKAMLAFLPDTERERILRKPLRRKTHRTVTEVDRLQQHLELIRQSGIAAETGENELAASCYGAPLFGPAGEVIAAISVAGPEGRMKDAGAERIRGLLIDAAQSITLELGGVWPGFGPIETTEM